MYIAGTSAGWITHVLLCLLMVINAEASMMRAALRSVGEHVNDISGAIGREWMIATAKGREGRRLPLSVWCVDAMSRVIDVLPSKEELMSDEAKKILALVYFLNIGAVLFIWKLNSDKRAGRIPGKQQVSAPPPWRPRHPAHVHRGLDNKAKDAQHGRGQLRDGLRELNLRIQAVLDRKGTSIECGISAEECAGLIKYARNCPDPLAGVLPTPVLPGGKVGFLERHENRDAMASKLLTGAAHYDGGGRGFLANNIMGDGACLFNSAAFLAYGPACSSMRQVLDNALPLRAAVCIRGLAQLERMLSNCPHGWGQFFCNLQAYDSSVTDRARINRVVIWTNKNSSVPDFFARVFFLYALQRITGEYANAQQFCFPLLAEVLHVNIRCFHPGRTVCDKAGGSWCKRVFAPKVGSHHNSARLPTLYITMSLMYHYHDFNSIQEFEQSCRVPMSVDHYGKQEAGYTHDFPDFRHFVPLLPPIDANDHEVWHHLKPHGLPCLVDVPPLPPGGLVAAKVMDGYEFVHRHTEVFSQSILAQLKSGCAGIFMTQWIQREYGSTVAHHAKVLASSSDEVGDDLRDLAPASHLEKLCQARAGTELVDLEVTTGNTRQEKNTVVCRLGRPSESSLICSTDRMWLSNIWIKFRMGWRQVRGAVWLY